MHIYQSISTPQSSKDVARFPFKLTTKVFTCKIRLFFLTLIDLLKSICLSFIYPLSKHSALCVTGSPQVWIESLYP